VKIHDDLAPRSDPRSTLTPAVAADITARGADVTISGRIEWNDDVTLSEAVTPQTKTVYLLSPGGYLAPSLRIAGVVRDRGLETVVAYATFCASGCAIIWLAGATRRILAGGRVGLHSASTDRRTRSAAGNEAMIGYLRQLGTVPQLVLALIEVTPPGGMYWFGPTEAVQLGLVPAIASTSDVPRECPIGHWRTSPTAECTPVTVCRVMPDAKDCPAGWTYVPKARQCVESHCYAGRWSE
jgi:hypothetical protein